MGVSTLEAGEGRDAGGGRRYEAGVTKAGPLGAGGSCSVAALGEDALADSAASVPADMAATAGTQPHGEVHDGGVGAAGKGRGVAERKGRSR